MSAFKESLDNHLPKVTKGLAWGAVKGATVGGLLFALNPLAGAIGAGIYYGKSMYNAYRKNPEDEIHFASALRKYVLGNRTNSNTTNTTGSLLGTLGGQNNTISNSPSNTPETQIDGEINDIEARINMWETQTRPPNTPSQLIIAQITANLANQEQRLIGNTYRATGGNLWNRTIGNRIRNRRNQRSILERINDIKDAQTQVRIMGRVTSLQNTMNTIRGRLGTPPPTINVGGNTMTRLSHTIGNPVSIDLRTAKTDINGNPLLPLPAGVTITDITITDSQTGAPIIPHTPFDPVTQSFQLNPTTVGEHNYNITYTDSLGRTSPNLNFVIESQDNLSGIPKKPSINGLNNNTASYTTNPQQIHGITSPNVTIELVDHADNIIAHTTSGSSGAYRIDTTLTNGIHQNLRIRAQNNQVPPQQNNSNFFNIDVNVPSTVNSIPLLPPTINISNLDQPTQTISGNTSPNTRIEILDGTNILQRTTSTDGNYNLSLNLLNGIHNLTIRVTDLNDLTNVQDSTITCTVDIPTTTSTATTLDNTNLSYDSTINGYKISGKSQPNVDITISHASKNLNTIKTDATGGFHVDIPTFTNPGDPSIQTLTLTYTDKNGTTKSDNIPITLA